MCLRRAEFRGLGELVLGVGPLLLFPTPWLEATKVLVITVEALRIDGCPRASLNYCLRLASGGRYQRPLEFQDT